MDAAMKISPPGAPSVQGEPAEDLGFDELDAEYAAMGSPEAPTVSEEQVRGLLKSVTGGLSYLLADDQLAPDLGRMTDDELDDLTPPLTRVVNGRPSLRAAVIRGDEAAVLLVLSRYGMRTIGGVRAVAAARDHMATIAPLNKPQEITSGDE